MARPKTYSRGKQDPKEVLFLDYYYTQDSETKGNAIASAIKAGYTEAMARSGMQRILNKFGDASAAVSLNAVGVNKPYLAARIKQVLESDSPKEILSAARLAFALMGETTDDAKGGNTNVFNAPVMVMVGATQERLKALRNATPQLSEAQLAALSEGRAKLNLNRLKAGEIFHKPHSRAKEYLEQKAKILNIDPNHVGGDSEATPDAGGHPSSESPGDTGNAGTAGIGS